MMRIALVILMLLLVAGAAPFVLRKPRADRAWAHELARAPVFKEEEDDGRWRLENMRAFEFQEDGNAAPVWRDTEIDPAALKEIWFFLEPFEAWDGAAHSLLSFVFDGDEPQVLSISVEARKEAGETYSGLRGAFNAYELIYLWSTEKDVLTRIAVSLDNDIYAYRLNTTPEQARAILEHFIRRTNALYDRPRFYNTLTSNCTNELAKVVNDAYPGALPWHYSHWMTGRSAQRLHSLGFLGQPETPFEALQAQANAHTAIKVAHAAPEPAFPALWRARMLEETANFNEIHAPASGE